jgi:FkbM family methyltransferase
MKIKPSDGSEFDRLDADRTLRFNYLLNNNSVVVDLGARHGNWAKIIRERYQPKMYCFEVVPEFCNELRTKGYNTFCTAVADREEVLTFGTVEGESSMYYEPKFESQSIPASKIFELINEEEIDLMKINVEGAEYNIIRNLIETGNIGKVKNLQVQFHLFDLVDKREEYEQLALDLSKTHYPSWKFPFVWENWKLKNY